MDQSATFRSILETAHSSPIFAGASFVGVLFAALFCFTSLWQKRAAKVEYPTVGTSDIKDFRPTLEEGAQLHPDQPFILPTPMHDIIVLPISAVDEIKRAPETQLSLRKHHYEAFQGQYTHFGTDTDELDAAIRVDLTRNVDKMLAAFQDEVTYAYEKVVGPAQTWTPVTLYGGLLEIIALLSSRAFVGLPLSREPEWVKTTCDYSMAVANGAHDLAPYPRWVRPILAPFMLTDLKKHHTYAAKMLGPILSKFENAGKADLANMVGTEGGDLIAYILSHYKHAVTAEKLGLDQLIATFAAIHTTTIAFTQTVFELAQRQEYVKPLRDEVIAALGDDARVPHFTKDSLHKLRLMDSFIKESQRLNPPSLVTMHRIVTAPDGVTLKSGHHLPHGAHVGVPNHLGNISHPDPDTFDGYRFTKLRAQPGHETMHQWVSAGLDHLNFGHGSHTCPGRFFASNEIKVALSYMLLNYDFKFAEGTRRPENIHTNTIVIPSHTAQVLFKARNAA